MDEKNYDVFISYAKKNSDWVIPFKDALKAELENLLNTEVSIFFDSSEIHTGEAWRTKIMKSVEYCGSFVPVYSPEFFESSMCKREYDVMDTRQIGNKESGLIVPVLHKEFNITPSYSVIQYKDFLEAAPDSEKFAVNIKILAKDLIPLINQHRAKNKSADKELQIDTPMSSAFPKLIGASELFAETFDESLKNSKIHDAKTALFDLREIVDENHPEYKKRTKQLQRILIDKLKDSIKQKDFELADEHIKSYKNIYGEDDVIAGFIDAASKAQNRIETQRQEIIQQAIQAYEAGNDVSDDFHSKTEFYTKAIDLFESIGTKPNEADEYSWAYNNRALCLKNLGQFEVALKDCNFSIDLKTSQQSDLSDLAIAINNRGNILFGMSKFFDAIADYTKAIELDPKFANAYRNRAISYRKFGDYARAEQDERKAKELENS